MKSDCDYCDGIGLLILFIIGGFMISFIFSHSTFIKTTEAGEHTGIITAVEKSGLIWKTWKIYFKTDTQSSQEDEYCVINEGLIPVFKELGESKAKVTILFDDYLFVGYGLCDGESAIITGAK